MRHTQSPAELFGPSLQQIQQHHRIDSTRNRDQQGLVRCDQSERCFVHSHGVKVPKSTSPDDPIATISAGQVQPNKLFEAVWRSGPRGRHYRHDSAGLKEKSADLWRALETARGSEWIVAFRSKDLSCARTRST